MKKIIILIFAATSLISCKKESLTPERAPELSYVKPGTDILIYGQVIYKAATVDSTHTGITVTNGGKTLDLVSVSSPSGSTKLQSKTGLEYYTIQPTGDVIMVNQIPFYTIGITPQANLVSCIKNSVALCRRNTACAGVYFTNIFGIGSFSFGMSLKCILGY